MAGIINTDATCNTHNALRNVSAYACGVSFSFKTDDFSGFDGGYAVVSVQDCCNKVNASVLRIPGNTGCEIQFCEVPQATTSYTETINYMYATGTGTAAQTPEPSVTSGAKIGPPGDVETCMQFVYEGDLPDDVANGISNVGSWCVVRNYDDESDEDETAVTANSAPASWTTAASDPWASAIASDNAARATEATSTSTSTSDAVFRHPKSVGTLVFVLVGSIIWSTF